MENSRQLCIIGSLLRDDFIYYNQLNINYLIEHKTKILWSKDAQYFLLNL